MLRWMAAATKGRRRKKISRWTASARFPIGTRLGGSLFLGCWPRWPRVPNRILDIVWNGALGGMQINEIARRGLTKLMKGRDE